MKKVLSILFLLSAITSCGQMVKDPLEYNGISLDCETEKDPCPTQENVIKMVNKFAECVHFDTQQTLTIHWYDQDETWRFVDPQTGKRITAVGFSSDKTYKDVYTTSEGVLFHELMHIKMYRDYGNMDSDHEQGNGPWHKEHNVLIRLVETNWFTNATCEQ